MLSSTASVMTRELREPKLVWLAVCFFFGRTEPRADDLMVLVLNFPDDLPAPLIGDTG